MLRFKWTRKFVSGLFFSFCLLLPGSVQAQKAKKAQNPKKVQKPLRAPANASEVSDSGEVNTARNRHSLNETHEKPIKSKQKLSAKSYFQIHAGLAYWQESIDLKNGAAKGQMESRVEGLLVAGSYVIPFSNKRWRQVYSAEAGLGVLRGKGETTTIPDDLENQPWYLLGLTPGIEYRTSLLSEIGLSLPAVYRGIQWKIDSGSTLEPDRKSSFSAGLELYHVAHFSKKSALRLSLTHQHMWQATLWRIGWQYDFR